MSTPNTPEPLDPSFRITLPSFEGPLDLLLHLIRKHELDILDLPIAFVTERYLEYVSMMEQLDLDIASEYLVMAATLAHIKSKMLLPQEPEDQVDDETPEEEVDPRAELIRRLLEYQKYKDAAEKLGSRGIAGRDVFPRGSDAPQASGPPALAPTSLFKLLDAFQAVLKRAKADLAFEITAEGISIQDRMGQLTELLRERREITFEMLFEGQVTIYDLVITFMAVLEMAKRRLVRIYQADPHSPIHLRSTVVGEDGEESGADDPFEPGGAAEAWPEPAPSPPSEPREARESDDEHDPDPESLELDFDAELDDIEELASLYDQEGEEALEALDESTEPASEAAVEAELPTPPRVDAAFAEPVDELADDAQLVSDATPDAEPEPRVELADAAQPAVAERATGEHASDPREPEPQPAFDADLELANEQPSAVEPTFAPDVEVLDELAGGSLPPSDEPSAPAEPTPDPEPPVEPSAAEPLAGERALDAVEPAPETVTEPVLESAPEPVAGSELAEAAPEPDGAGEAAADVAGPDHRQPASDFAAVNEPVEATGSTTTLDRTVAAPEPDDGLDRPEWVALGDEGADETVAEPAPTDGLDEPVEPAFEPTAAESEPADGLDEPVEPAFEPTAAESEPADGLDELESTALADEGAGETVTLEPAPVDSFDEHLDAGSELIEPEPAGGLDELESTALADEGAGETVAEPAPVDGFDEHLEAAGSELIEPEPDDVLDEPERTALAEAVATPEPTDGLDEPVEPAFEPTAAESEPADGLDEPERTALADEAAQEAGAEPEPNPATGTGDGDRLTEPVDGMDEPVEPARFELADGLTLESTVRDPDAGHGLDEPGRSEVADETAFEPAVAEPQPAHDVDEPEQEPEEAAEETVAEPEPEIGAGDPNRLTEPVDGLDEPEGAALADEASFAGAEPVGPHGELVESVATEPQPAMSSSGQATSAPKFESAEAAPAVGFASEQANPGETRAGEGLEPDLGQPKPPPAAQPAGTAAFEAGSAHDELFESETASADAPPPLEGEEEMPRRPGAAASEVHTAQTDAAASDEDEDA